MNLKDESLILFFAFRYALGRRTYAVGAVVDDIVDNWEEIEAHTKAQIKKEIREYSDLGCYHTEWSKILALP